MTSGPTSDVSSPGGAPRRWRRADDALWRVVPGSLVVLGSAADGPQLLTGPAVEAWALLAEPRTADELADALAARYEIATAEITGDVTGLVADLADHGLVVSVADDEVGSGPSPTAAP